VPRPSTKSPQHTAQEIPLQKSAELRWSAAPDEEAKPPRAEVEGEAAPPLGQPPEDEDEDILPNPLSPFAFVSDARITPELKAALSVRYGGAPGLALHAAAAGDHVEVVDGFKAWRAHPREWSRRDHTLEEKVTTNEHFEIRFAEWLWHSGGLRSIFKIGT
jgi:hypothetical protein